MATHDVSITRMPRRLVGSNDIIFEIREDRQKLGDLRVSQGNLYWLPTARNFGYILEWNQLTEVFTRNGRRRRYTY